MFIEFLRPIVLGLWGIAPGNYSGITHIEGNQYAICDDKDAVDGFKVLTLDIDSTNGNVLNATMTEPKGMQQRRAKGVATNRDCEGIAYFPDEQTIFVSGEEDQRIMEYTLDGITTGRELAIPKEMQRSSITPNRGFEALTYNATTGLFWTTTESALPADCVTKNDSINQPLRMVSFGRDLRPLHSFVYRMDAPEYKPTKSFWGGGGADIVHGVPALTALDDGRIIVMEREACINKRYYDSWVTIKLYMVTPPDEKTSSSGNNTFRFQQTVVKKTLLGSFTTRLRLGQMDLSNYEGMCLGPRLSDGRQTLLLIADSQNGAGNSLFRIKDHLRVVIIDEL